MEHTILLNLRINANFTRKVLPYVKVEYFPDSDHQLVFSLIKGFFSKYNACPSIQALIVELTEKENISTQTAEKAEAIIKTLHTSEVCNFDWLLDQTEKWCQERALYIALLKSIAVFQGKEAGSRASIPGMLTESLSVCFDPSIGHNYWDDASSRFDYYHDKLERIPFAIDMLNKVTHGGFAKKTLNIFVAGTNVGKTLLMCSLAADNMRLGHNVLYVTAEMSQMEISKRIDSNILNIKINELEDVDKPQFLSKLALARKRASGILAVKEYPNGKVSASDIKELVAELKLKQGFIPDVVYVDYLGICSSSSFKSREDKYGFGKAVAEEMRAMSIETNTCVITAAQTNRSGYNNTDPDIDVTAESFGVPMTGDFLGIIITTEELAKANQYCLIQGKSRYGNKNQDKRFLLNVDYDHMRVSNVANGSFTGLRTLEPQYTPTKHEPAF